MDTVTKQDSVTSSSERRDGVSPTPWRVEKSPASSNFWVVRCDTGVSVATAWREADAAFIVEAVNERDSLRELVRRLVYQFEVRAHYDDEVAIIREAREAAGEDKQ